VFTVVFYLGNSSFSLMLEYTQVEEIGSLVDKARQVFDSNVLLTVQNRLNQLRNLYYVLLDHQTQFEDALSKDFNRSRFETSRLELAQVFGEILYVMQHLESWSKPQKVDYLPLSFGTTYSTVEKIPLGVILIIAPFNYPIVLSLSPIIGAIAAGNTVVFKPSELTPNCSTLLTEVLQSCFDYPIVSVVNGGITETQKLLEPKFDKIMFTGSGHVGKIISKAAAEHLTPVILELGGKSPCFLTSNCKTTKIKALLSRIIWSSFVNSGQTCVAVDYLLVHESIYSTVVQESTKILKEFYCNITEKSDFTHLIDRKSFKRTMTTLQRTKGKKISFGVSHEDTNFIPPTLICDVSWDDETMQSENFAPILPIIKYSSLEDVVSEVKTEHDTPLACYIFSEDPQEQRYILNNLRSGGVCINETMMHVGLYTAPFGGIGDSGYGNYHGKWSFDSFSHSRTVLKQPLWAEFLIKARYPPYTRKNRATLELLDKGVVWFDRSGNVPSRRSYLTKVIGYCGLMVTIAAALIGKLVF